jgi:preprotein translocase subunit SecE
VARNRKRAKERRARRPQPVASSRREASEDVPNAIRRDAGEDAPNPIAHASPDGELAEAQMARGRPEPGEEPSEEELEEFEEPKSEAEADSPAPGVVPGRLAVETGPVDAVELEPESEDDEDGRGELEPAAGRAVEPRGGLISRMVNFVRGSWRELQRVQWPDRRQVMQATGVVIGFVIVAGLYLGVADFLAGKLMDYVLK